jgi:hypothetical protein
LNSPLPATLFFLVGLIGVKAFRLTTVTSRGLLSILEESEKSPSLLSMALVKLHEIENKEVINIDIDSNLPREHHSPLWPAAFPSRAFS